MVLESVAFRLIALSLNRELLVRPSWFIDFPDLTDFDCDFADRLLNI
jgi:hypothetical protein